MNFSLGISQIFVELEQVDILLLMTSSTTSTSMLVKEALATNETKVPSSGLMDRLLIL